MNKVATMMASAHPMWLRVLPIHSMLVSFNCTLGDDPHRDTTCNGARGKKDMHLCLRFFGFWVRVSKIFKTKRF